MALSQKPKGGTTRYRRNWDTVGLEVFWSRASKTVSDLHAWGIAGMTEHDTPSFSSFIFLIFNE